MADFDAYSEEYKGLVEQSISFINQKADFFIESKAILIHEAIKNHFLDDAISILDVGCGTGITDSFLGNYYKNINGIDVSEKSVQLAKKNNPGFIYTSYDGLRLPYKDNEFDVVFAICVFHHVNPLNWQVLLDEMKRVTKKDGLTFVFEHNPLNPLTRKAVRDCSFDHDAILLPMKTLKDLFRKSGFSKLKSNYIIFFPFSNRFVKWIEAKLFWCLMGAQYFVMGKK